MTNRKERRPGSADISEDKPVAKNRVKWRRACLKGVMISMGASVFFTPLAAAAQQSTIELKKTPTCGCCSAWGDRMQSAGFAVHREDMTTGQLMKFKMKHGIRGNFACHTARIEGYTIEGHVPEREIRRLLQERPDAIGLSVPGMPLGSPGMDFGKAKEAYDVLLIRKDGSAAVYSHYPAKN